MVFVKFLICVVLWMIAYRICEKFPFDFMQTMFSKNKDGKPTQYQYFHFYTTVYMIVFLIVFLIL